jgi:hypothetical protein
VMYLQLSSMSYVSRISCSAFNRSWKDCTGANTDGCLERLMWPLCTHCRTGGHHVWETSSRHSVPCAPPPPPHTTTGHGRTAQEQTQSNIVSSVYKCTTVQMGFKCRRNVWEDMHCLTAGVMTLELSGRATGLAAPCQQHQPQTSNRKVPQWCCRTSTAAAQHTCCLTTSATGTASTPPPVRAP